MLKIICFFVIQRGDGR